MTAYAAEKAMLEARLDELRARLAAIDAELDSHDTTDWEDQAVEREDDEVLERMGTSAKQEIQRIVTALRRIDSGDYGTCARCGGDIAPERRAAVPDAVLCRACAG